MSVPGSHTNCPWFGAKLERPSGKFHESQVTQTSVGTRTLCKASTFTPKYESLTVDANVVKNRRNRCIGKTTTPGFKSPAAETRAFRSVGLFLQQQECTPTSDLALGPPRPPDLTDLLQKEGGFAHPLLSSPQQICAAPAPGCGARAEASERVLPPCRYSGKGLRVAGKPDT